MKIAFPTDQANGLESPVYGHFGSAPSFVVIDSDNEQVDTVINRDVDHVHGQCQPVAALGGNEVHAIVVGGIGGGALMKLNAAGIKVYKAVEGSVKDNLSLIKSGTLPELTMQQTCAGHQHGQGGCAH